jgi:hypothetical protein
MSTTKLLALVATGAVIGMFFTGASSHDSVAPSPATALTFAER